MVNIKNNKKCARNKCSSFVYTKSAHARQLGLCKEHFYYYTKKYVRCTFCNSLLKIRGKLFCNLQCKELNEIRDKNLFKSFDKIVSNILLNMPAQTQIYFLNLTLNDAFLDYLQLQQALKKPLQQLEANYYKQKYLSILKFSFCYCFDLLSYYYAIVPDVILDKINTHGSLLRALQISKIDKSSFINTFNIMENSNILDNSFDYRKKPSTPLAFCFSNDEPYHALPILNHLYEYMSCFCVIKSEMKNLQIKIDNLLKNIMDIKQRCRIKHNQNKEDALDIDPLYIEICALVLLYSLVFRNKMSYESVFIDLSEKFQQPCDANSYSSFNLYFNEWFRTPDSRLAPYNKNTKHDYKNFYQSLFLVYQKEIPKNSA